MNIPPPHLCLVRLIMRQITYTGIMDKSFKRCRGNLISSISQIKDSSWWAGWLGSWFLSGWLVESLILPAVAVPHFILRERQTVGESSTLGLSALTACRQGFRINGRCEMASLQSNFKNTEGKGMTLCNIILQSYYTYIKPGNLRNHSLNLAF